MDLGSQRAPDEDHDDLTPLEERETLIAQLHYDRAAIAQIHPAAAAAMDLVIMMVGAGANSDANDHVS